MTADPDVVVVGAGPNGLAAAVALAQLGCRVLVLEEQPEPGGGARTEECTLPGFRHDLCSAIHPLALASPFLAGLGLERHGLEWIHPEIPVVHPLDGDRAAILERSVDQTARALGADGAAWRRLVGTLAADWPRLGPELLAPLHLPRHPWRMARFALGALRSATGLASAFAGPEARALFAGLAAHSCLPLERPASAAFGLVLGALAHAVGWPFPRGGAGAITRALVSLLEELGGEVVTGHRVTDVDRLPPSRAVVLDLTPRQVLEVAGHRLPSRYRRRLQRYRYGPGACKVDWAVEGPIPWLAEPCRRTACVHVGGEIDEVAASESAVWRGEIPERPFVLLAQPSVFDPSRAPAGCQAVWAYCHVPHGSPADLADRIEAQVERFAPGFRDRILERRTRAASELPLHNANLVGGDVNGGVQDLGQLLTRPVLSLDPYRTPHPGLFLCSASTPPGGGVHGMCGYHAARSVARRNPGLVSAPLRRGRPRR